MMRRIVSKRMNIVSLSLFFIVLFISGIVGTAKAYPGFINDAVGPAQASQRETTVPASVTIAQAILESGWGNKHIGEANNYFGIKAFSRNDGTVDYGNIAIGWVEVPTREWNGSEYVTVISKFRKYKSMKDSFRDQGYFFLENSRYAEALKHVDYPDQFAREIHKAGYATGPVYADNLINLMHRYNLYQYDLNRDDAILLMKSEPVTVAPTEKFKIFFQIQNTGFGTWRGSDGYALANVNQQPLGAPSVRQINQKLKPDDIGEFHISMVAPKESGVYRTEWRLVHAGPFGPLMYIDITVKKSSDVPSSDGLQKFMAGILNSAIQKISHWWNTLWQDAKRNVQRELDNLENETRQQLKEKQHEINESIKKEAEKQVQNFVDDLLNQCFGPIAMAGMALAFVYHKQRR